MRLIDSNERRARLGVRHHLAAPAGTIERVAGDMVGLHSSDAVSVYLAARARLADLTRSEVESALYDRRSLLRMLGMRRTIFVVPVDLGAVMDAACTRAFAAAENRRLARMVEQQGIATDGAKWVAGVGAATLAAIAARGEAAAGELTADVPELALKIRFGEGTKWAGDAGMSTRVLFLLATEGRIIRGRPRGSWISTQYRWAPLADWLGHPLPPFDPVEARRDLLTRWLRSFGPGTIADLKWWTGWSLRDTRAALAACDAVEVGLDSGTGYMLADDLEPVARPEPWAALLPGLDSTPMGWKDRDWFLGGHAGVLYDRNGNVGPTVWCDGRIVGGWAQTSTGEVAVRLLESLSRRHTSLVERSRRELEEWLGGDTITPRFRTPLERELAAG